MSDQNEKNNQRLHFSSTGITCSGCANSVRTILGRLPGVTDVEVDVLRKTVDVEIRTGEVTAEQLMAALKPAGYGLLPTAA
ncbi:MAG: heavy-metal-associated domain-containing protein [Flavobacteriales bacterium]|jgi:copper chaperone CopZ|nr:heavy-metal-associated domain-containing protein [Flavobacteriales bacterium]